MGQTKFTKFARKLLHTKILTKMVEISVDLLLRRRSAPKPLPNPPPPKMISWRSWNQYLTWELELVHTLISQTKQLPSQRERLRKRSPLGKPLRSLLLPLNPNIWDGGQRLLQVPHLLFWS